jgi:hypothetical protein
MVRRLILAFLGLFVLTSTAFAQQGTSDLSGRVVDQQGAVLPGVAIVARHQDDIRTVVCSAKQRAARTARSS